MDNTSTVRMLLDTLMEHKELHMWTIYQEPSGSTFVKMRFLDNQNGSQQQDRITEQQNSKVYYRRKSEKHIKRDRLRAQQHARARINTRSVSNAKEIIASDSVETPRFDLVNSAGENLSHMHSTSTISSPGASDRFHITTEITDSEQSPIISEPEISLPELDSFLHRFNMPDVGEADQYTDNENSNDDNNRNDDLTVNSPSPIHAVCKNTLCYECATSVPLSMSLFGSKMLYCDTCNDYNVCEVCLALPQKRHSLKCESRLKYLIT